MKAYRSGSASKAPLGAASIDRLIIVAYFFLRDHPLVPLWAKVKDGLPLDPTAADLASDASIMPDCIQAYTNCTPLYPNEEYSTQSIKLFLSTGCDF
jgi:hypothetical protein